MRKRHLNVSAEVHTSASVYRIVSSWVFNSICLWNRRMFKVVDKEFLTLDLKNTWILQNYYIRELKMYFSLFSFHRWFPLEHVFTYISLMQWGEKSNFKHIISTRVHQKKIKNYFKEYVMWKRFKSWPMKNVFRKR